MQTKHAHDESVRSLASTFIVCRCSECAVNANIEMSQWLSSQGKRAYKI